MEGESVEYLATARVARQCEMFAPYIGRCAVAICNDRRYRFKTYHKVFFGEELITWLCDERLVMNRYVACGCVAAWLPPGTSAIRD